ncbi:DUF427 domain-containing protein [Shimia abyssi]|uniref:Uncharacterized protein (DUF427 family) n=1 Tax=Shimia abyssi TaxID=1662395 RepID=A0A2P8FJM1_9RHOB|nr:DUF427 domain-containing protein [Shimia abyssi]PSL21920.1 uncharacterized protein (DUF427 family) [Shimia abyssi]
MTTQISIRKAQGNWTVRAGGAVLGESANALELEEAGYEPTIYFPRDDIAMAFLDDNGTKSQCSKKGEATHYTIVTKSRTITDAAWSYEAPSEAAERLKNYIGFKPSELVAVERV